jgi:hypothetical protein
MGSGVAFEGSNPISCAKFDKSGNGKPANIGGGPLSDLGIAAFGAVAVGVLSLGAWGKARPKLTSVAMNRSDFILIMGLRLQSS